MGSAIGIAIDWDWDCDWEVGMMESLEVDEWKCGSWNWGIRK